MFEDIIGHAAVKNGLIHATQTGRLHHALLFTGPDGIGKGLLGRAFVQAWMCKQTTPESLQRCQNCTSCRRIAENNHPDFIEIIEGLRGHTSGYCIPTFVVDAPGGGGKTPVMPQYVISQAPGRVVLRNFEGVITTYSEPMDYKNECN